MKSKLKKTIALVLVGGSGERFGKEKQFVLALNRPLMSFAIEELGLSPYIDEIVLVGKKGTLNKTLEIGKAYANNKLKAVIEGGKTRQESSYKGVKFLIDSGFSSDSIVLIQDGDRPNITQANILKYFFHFSLSLLPISSLYVIHIIPTTENIAIIIDTPNI